MKDLVRLCVGLSLGLMVAAGVSAVKSNQSQSSAAPISRTAGAQSQCLAQSVALRPRRRKGRNMAVTFRAASSIYATNTVSKPTGTVDGDVMIATVGTAAGGTISAPTGWTQIRTTANGANRLSTFYKVASGEGSNYTFTMPFGGSSGVISIVSYSGVDNASVYDVESGADTGTTTTPIAPSITTTVANTMIVASFFSSTIPTWTPPAGMTERVDTPDTLDHAASQEVAEVAQAAAGASGTKTATASTSGATLAHIVALKSSGGSPPANNGAAFLAMW